MIEVCVYDNAQGLTPENWQYGISLLPTFLRISICTLRLEQDQQNSLLGKLLIKHMLSKFGYESNILNDLTYSEYKRPFLNLSVDFNISHSGHFVACALTTMGRVGIDVEEIRPITLPAIGHFFCEDEINLINQPDKSLENFYKIWSLKESIIKADGRGFSMPATQIRKLNCTADNNGNNWKTSVIDIATDYAGAVAYNINQEIVVHKVSLSTLFNTA